MCNRTHTNNRGRALNRLTKSMSSEKLKSFEAKEKEEIKKLFLLKRRMLHKLQEFRHERNQMKLLRLQDDNHNERTINLIKHEVIDVHDKFDEMSEEMKSQEKNLQKMI
jgi:hypothetical protein